MVILRGASIVEPLILPGTVVPALPREPGSASIAAGALPPPGSAPLPGTGDSDHQYDHLDRLLARFAARSVDDPRRRGELEQLVAGYLPVARHIARRYARGPADRDDLEQVAAIGLLGALGRYDPARGVPFLGFAVPTIIGEVKRHFRDRTWMVRVPRALTEAQAPLAGAIETLSARLGRAPRPSELAAQLGWRLADTLEALCAREAYTPTSLDAPTATGGAGSATVSLGERLPDPHGRELAALDVVEHRAALQEALAQLSDRDRTVVVLRFFRDMTQTQIGAELGISQMHVSRLLTKALATLRAHLGRD